MNDVKKGAVTAVLATVVTSAMILMSGKGNADNTESVPAKAQSTNVGKTTIEIVEMKTTDLKSVEKTVEGIKVETEKQPVTKNLIAKVRVDTHLPPPGPFTKESAAVMVKPQAPKVSTPPLSPEAPKQVVEKKPETPQPPKSNIEKPVQQAVASLAPKTAEKIEVTPKEGNAPQMTTNKPFKPEVPSLNAEPKKSPELPINTSATKQQMAKAPVAPQANTFQKPAPKNSNQPIWMQKNNMGAAKTAPQMNMGTNKPNQVNGKQMPNPYGVRYMQQYKYMPMPVYPDYQYPQMPRYNGGYYFAPIPNYWMQRGMQMPNPQARMKMNQAPQAPSKNEGSSK